MSTEKKYPPRVWINKRLDWQHGYYVFAYKTKKHPDTEEEYLSLEEHQALLKEAEAEKAAAVKEARAKAYEDVYELLTKESAMSPFSPIASRLRGEYELARSELNELKAARAKENGASG